MSVVGAAILDIISVIEKESEKKFEIQRSYNRSTALVEYKNESASPNNRGN
jgi:hypothetical protein